MKFKTRWLAAVALFVSALVVPISVMAGDQDLHKESLRGVKGMKVLIEHLELGDRTSQIGLTESQIQTDVELKLRLAGITVLNNER